MRVGDKITIRLGVECGEKTPVSARVVYIHPQRRYYVAEFTIGGRTAREAFLCPDRESESDWRKHHGNHLHHEPERRGGQNRHR
jgi:hypothetical protein